MRHLILILTLALSSAAHAASIDDDAGSYGFSFLKVRPGARALALAGAGVAARGMFSGNPAALVGTGAAQAELSHVRWLSTVTQSEFIGATPAWGGALGVSLRFQSSGDIPLRGADESLPWNGVPSAEPDGTYGVYDAAVTVGYSRAFSSVDLGISTTYLYEKVYLASAHAFAVSFGAQRQFGAFRVGGAVRNVGIAGAMEDESEDVPWDGVLGVAYEASLAGVALRGLADVRYAPDYHETIHLGIEGEPVESFVVRAGYQRGITAATGDDSFSFGAAFRVRSAEFGYAYRPGPDGLGSRHALTVRYTGAASAGGVGSHAGS